MSATGPIFTRPNGDIFPQGYRTGIGEELFKIGTSVGPPFAPARTDILGRHGEAGQWYLGLSTGSAFETSYWGAWSTSVTWVDVKVGDFDGDGKTDLVGRYKEAGQWYVSRSTGAGFVNALWASWAANVTWADIHSVNFA